MISDERLQEIRVRVDAWRNEQLGPPVTVVEELLAEVERLAARGRHTVHVLGLDGRVRIVCDHTFKGGPRCVHCGKSFVELRAEAAAEVAALAARPRDPDVVSIPIGATLRSRIDRIVARGPLGESFDGAVQTMFILGLLEAEGMNPPEYVGEVAQHIGADAVFVRFALSSDPNDPRSRETLRDLFGWVSAWQCRDDEPLARALEQCAALT